MNKKIFINKYDYMRYYTRCKEVRFLKNNLIDEAINQTLNSIKIDEIDEDLDDEDVDDEAIDNYEEYRAEKFFITNINDINYSKQENDPRIIEGQIIDKQAKKYIKEQYSHIKNIIDYDDKKYFNIQFDNEKASLQTNQDIKYFIDKNEPFIMFQPTFISKTEEGSNLVTKCDAIVYEDEFNCTLIEVKGTTSSKIIHYLDFLFQLNVINSKITKQLISINNCKLCLVKYCRALLNEVPFNFTEFVNNTKQPPQINKKKKELMNENDLILEKQKYKLGKLKLKIIDLYEENFEINDKDQFIEHVAEQIETDSSEKQIKSLATKLITIISNIYGLNQSFFNCVNKLYKDKHEIKNTINLVPCEECKSKYKNCDFWLKCRDIFKNEYLLAAKNVSFNKDKYENYLNLKPFAYSGNVLKQFNAYKKLKDNFKESEIDEIKEQKGISYIYLLNHDLIKNKEQTKRMWDLLSSRNKRVYFDFESINTAIRPMDNVFPFNQVITQNSVIKTKNKYEEYDVIDMIKDPLKLDLNWIKSIIDKLYEPDDVWYIVFNKNFECTRLNEMGSLINEDEYYKKINKINNNIFDLADFFNPRKENIILKDLRGFYSIKKILELIPTKILEQTQTKSYHDLEIYNGAVAQTETTKRFFHLVDDNRWNHIEKQLQIYCCNDVRAMIAVELFVKSKIDELLDE